MPAQIIVVRVKDEIAGIPMFLSQIYRPGEAGWSYQAPSMISQDQADELARRLIDVLEPDCTILWLDSESEVRA